MYRIIYPILLSLIIAACIPAQRTYVIPRVSGVTREYHLTITTTAILIDGVEYRRYLINGESPGPKLQASIGDFLKVTLDNQTDRALNLNWHGLLIPNHQDGVPALTSEPIEPGTTFVYNFMIQQTGSYWYHAYGLETSQGIYGPIVLLETDTQEDPLHTLLFSGQLNNDPESILAEMRYPSRSGSITTTNDQISNYLYHLINDTINEYHIPYQGSAYIQLRLINSYIDGFLNLVYSGGPITVIAADGLPVRPVQLTHLPIAMGESYDVILPIQPNREHELIAFFLGSDQFSRIMLGNGPSHRLPSYNSDDFPGYPIYYQLMTQVPTFIRWPHTRRVNQRFDMEIRNNQYYHWSIVDRDAAIHRTLIRLQAGDFVEINLLNNSNYPQPMHLHGHFFEVTSNPQFLLQHTYNLQPQENITIRFPAEYLGYWLFHSQNLFHRSSQLSLSIHVRNYRI